MNNSSCIGSKPRVYKPNRWRPSMASLSPSLRVPVRHVCTFTLQSPIGSKTIQQWKPNMLSDPRMMPYG
eukprot:4754225-Amphidinium_carterae.1